MISPELTRNACATVPQALQLGYWTQRNPKPGFLIKIPEEFKNYVKKRFALLSLQEWEPKEYALKQKILSKKNEPRLFP